MGVLRYLDVVLHISELVAFLVVYVEGALLAGL